MQNFNTLTPPHSKNKIETHLVSTNEDVEISLVYHLPDGFDFSLSPPFHSQNIMCATQKIKALQYYKLIHKSRENFEKEVLSKIYHIQALKPLYTYFNKAFDCTAPITPLQAMKELNQKQLIRAFKEFNIGDLVKSFSPQRIAISGKELTKKQYDKAGNRIQDVTYNAVYETYQLNIPSGGSGNAQRQLTAFAVKCWCTTTNNEHWIHIEEAYKNDPLEAIASTFRVHSHIIPYIKELKRQGDILIVELKQDVDISTPILKSSLVPLTAEQYFSLLTIET